MFEVSWCVVGKDPDAEPFWFNNFEDAQKFLADELFWLARDEEDSKLSSAASMAGFDLKEKTVESDFGVVIGNVSYWLINRSEINSWVEF